MGRRNIGERGLAIVAHYEGERNPKCGWNEKQKLYHPYLDAVGIPTIGLGTIAYPNGVRVKMSDAPIDEKTALYCMNCELDEKEDAVVKMCQVSKLDLLDCEFDAIVSMAYNCGIGILEPGSSLRTALMNGNSKKIQDAMMLYVKGTKKILGIKYKVVLPGLVSRRKTEFDLFSRGLVKFYN